jgi:hypothetical protein
MRTKKMLMPIPKLLATAQRTFNAWVRNRDYLEDECGFVCISCGEFKDRGSMQAGHYVPQKGGSFLRYHPDNVHGECAGCNGFDQFHLVGYRKNLIDRIGEDRVEYLEKNRSIIKKWSRSELLEIIKTYSL